MTRILVSSVWTTDFKKQYSNLIQHLKRLLMNSNTLIWKVCHLLQRIHTLSHVDGDAPLLLLLCTLKIVPFLANINYIVHINGVLKVVLGGGSISYINVGHDSNFLYMSRLIIFSSYKYALSLSTTQALFLMDRDKSDPFINILIY